jgi:hypothetical protein
MRKNWCASEYFVFTRQGLELANILNDTSAFSEEKIRQKSS